MSEQALIYELVRKHGRATTSFQTLGEHFRYWFDGQHGGCEDAYVAYTEVGDSWVVAGGPVCPKERELELMERFAAEARRRGKRVRFFMLERDVANESSFATQHIGDHPVWDPAGWPAPLGKKLRDQLRRARSKGLVTTRLATVDEMRDLESPTRRGVDRVIAQWLDSRRIAPLGFVLELDLFNRLEERRYFVAEFEGEVVGVMIALPVYARNGWFIDNMLRTPNAPNGTVELLFDCMMTTFKAEGSRHVTLGLSPFAGATSLLMRFFRECMGALYNFKGLHSFKRKLRPTTWEPMYIAFPKEERGASAMMSVIRAFLHGSWGRFYWDSMIQRARFTTALWGADVAVWLLGTVVFGGGRWFWSGANLGAWIGFDLVMIGALLGVARYFKRWSALVVSGLTAANAALFGAQIVKYSAAHAHGLDYVWLALGVVGPLSISRFLWDSRGRYEARLPARVVQPELPAAPVATTPQRRAAADSAPTRAGKSNRSSGSVDSATAANGADDMLEPVAVKQASSGSA